MLGACYYPEHWPEEWWTKDAQRMRELRHRLCPHRRIRLVPLRAEARGVRLGVARPGDRCARRRRAENRARHPDGDAAQMADRRISRDPADRQKRGGRAVSAHAGTMPSRLRPMGARAPVSPKPSPGATAVIYRQWFISAMVGHAARSTGRNIILVSYLQRNAAS